MDAIKTFKKTVKLSDYIQGALEPLARMVEGNEDNGDATKYNYVVAELHELFPEEDADQIAQALITEACRMAYLKMKQDQAARNFAHGK